jgi:hypothetical protein
MCVSNPVAVLPRLAVDQKLSFCDCCGLIRSHGKPLLFYITAHFQAHFNMNTFGVYHDMRLFAITFLPARSDIFYLPFFLSNKAPRTHSNERKEVRSKKSLYSLLIHYIGA